MNFRFAIVLEREWISDQGNRHDPIGHCSGPQDFFIFVATALTFPISDGAALAKIEKVATPA